MRLRSIILGTGYAGVMGMGSSALSAAWRFDKAAIVPLDPGSLRAVDRATRL
jgi:hypothetical protein